MSEPEHEIMRVGNALPDSGLGEDSRPQPEGSERPDWWTSDHWATPRGVFAAISRRYGPFDLDACATQYTAKCPLWYGEQDNGLEQPWRGRVWVNPPYSNPRPWIARAVEAVQRGEAERVVMLLPSATDTTWFHDLVLPNAEVVFVRGRIRFIGWRGTPIGTPKAGNIIAVFPKPSQAFSLSATEEAGSSPRVPLMEGSQA